MSQERPIIDLVIGTRPNIVKAGPLFAAMKRCGWCLPRLVFLAQHRQSAMTTEVLEDVGIENFEVLRIDVDADGPGFRMGEMMGRFAQHLQARRPRMVVVFGDVDSTLAAAYSAKRQHLPVAHVEAGLRSGDMTMPEELNRRMVDGISDLLLTTTQGAGENLQREGRGPADIRHVGNLMIDALKSTGVDRDDPRKNDHYLETYGLHGKAYAIATFHRPSNVDQLAHLQRVIDVLGAAAKRLPVVFPAHPRVQAALQKHGLEVSGRVRMVPPLRYATFISLLSGARMALTDSGGLQEETSVLGIPCLTFRANTERPETITMGTNRLVQPREAGKEIDRLLASPMPAPAEFPLWDGNAAPRTVSAIQEWLGQERSWPISSV